MGRYLHDSAFAAASAFEENLQLSDGFEKSVILKGIRGDK